MRSHDPFGTCRNCGCHIMWVKTKAGKNMPVDPTMISYRRPGAGVKAKEKIVTPEGEVVCADKVSSESAEGLYWIGTILGTGLAKDQDQQANEHILFYL